MRVFVATTLAGLTAAHLRGTFGQEPVGESPAVLGHAVTPSVREWYVSDDLEELEFAVLLEAAEASLRLLADQNDGQLRRVVVAVDVPDETVYPLNSARFRSAVGIRRPVPFDAVVSVHVDEQEASGTVSAAIVALPAADAGDADSQFLLDEAEACDLLWYDVTEVPHIR